MLCAVSQSWLFPFRALPVRACREPSLALCLALSAAPSSCVSLGKLRRALSLTAHGAMSDCPPRVSPSGRRRPLFCSIRRLLQALSHLPSPDLQRAPPHLLQPQSALRRVRSASQPWTARKLLSSPPRRCPRSRRPRPRARTRSSVRRPLRPRTGARPSRRRRRRRSSRCGGRSTITRRRSCVGFRSS